MSNPKDHFASLDRDLTSEETASLEARQQFVKDNMEIVWAPHADTLGGVPAGTGDALILGSGRIGFPERTLTAKWSLGDPLSKEEDKLCERMENDLVAQAKLEEARSYQDRNRSGSSVPPSKSKAAKRSRAKAARKARKQQRRV